MLSESDLNIFAVVGKPISYSQSPSMMNVAFRTLNLNAIYIRIASETTEDAIETIHQLGISGCNITAPFKETIIPYLTEIDSRSKKIGSVNTIVRKGNELIGYNTDVNGIFSSLNQYVGETEDLFTLVIGTGGAARAAIYTAQNMKTNVFVCGRDYDKALNLAEQTGCQAVKMERIQQTINICTIVISTVPRNADIINNITFSPWHIVLDSIYPNPNLQHNVELSKGIYIPAEQWLLYQAFPAFKIFTNEDAPAKIMEESLKQTYQQKLNCFSIIGFSNQKITEISQHLAPFFKNNIIDLEDVIQHPMLTSQNPLENSDKVLITCSLEQLSTPDLQKFIKTQTFTFWVNEEIDIQTHQHYLENFPLLAQLTDVLIPCFQKTAEEIACAIQNELTVLLSVSETNF